MSGSSLPDGLNVEHLRREIRKEYRDVADNPEKGFHFHTGRRLAEILEYREEWLGVVPEDVLASFAGTGNPFSMGEMSPGVKVLDLGCGAGIDSFIAASQVGEGGMVRGFDMTDEMLAKAQKAREGTNLTQLKFEQGFMEAIPVPDGWADVVISNGALNLCPDKMAAFKEIHRVLKTGGRFQIGDILVSKPVSDSAKKDIDLWTG